MLRLPPLRLPPTCTRRPLDCTIWPSNMATVTRRHIVTPSAATAKQHRKTAPALSANDKKQKTSKVTGPGQTRGHPSASRPATDDFAVCMQNAEFRVGGAEGRCAVGARADLGGGRWSSRVGASARRGRQAPPPWAYLGWCPSGYLSRMQSLLAKPFRLRQTESIPRREGHANGLHE